MADNRDIELGTLQAGIVSAPASAATAVEQPAGIPELRTSTEPPEEGKRPYEDLLAGFPRTARFIGADPDHTLVIFSRFHETSVRNLLNLEARVAALELVQKELDKEDIQKYQDNKDIVIIPRSWEDFALLGTGDGTQGNLNIPDRALDMWRENRKLPWPSQRRNSNPKMIAPSLDCDNATLKLVQDRWAVALAIQDAIKEYEEALLRYRKILSLERPPRRSWEVVEQWIRGIVFGEKLGTVQFLKKTGMQTVMNDFYDCVSLRPMAGDDPVSKQVAKSKWIGRFREKDYAFEQVRYVPEKIVHRAVTIITLSTAVFFLVAAVWVLWVTERTHFTIRLAVLTVFVILFGLWINLATNAERSEVFGATAAYAAVLVVFVGKG